MQRLREWEPLPKAPGLSANLHDFDEAIKLGVKVGITAAVDSADGCQCFIVPAAGPRGDVFVDSPFQRTLGDFARLILGSAFSGRHFYRLPT
jgi:hypothetical protein